jgi:hypothetical protein
VYDFAQTFRQMYGDEITDSPAGLAAMRAAKALYDRYGDLAERIVAAQSRPAAEPEGANPSEAPTIAELHERLAERMRA